MVETSKKILRKKKKKWFSIIAPKEFDNIEIGETLVEDPKTALGKKIVLSMMNLTGEIKKQNVKIIFKAIDVREDKILTDIVGQEISQSHLKRIIKRAKSKVEESFISTTKDNVKIRIKPIVLTGTKTHSSVLKAVRKNMMETLLDKIKNNDYKSLVGDIITNKLQREVRENIRKIYPVSIVEIKSMYIV